MNEYEMHNQRIWDLELARRRIVGELMEKPFEDRVMQSGVESELQEIEHLLITTPPIIGSHDHQPVYKGRGLLPEPGDAEIEGLLTVQEAGITVIPQHKWPAYIAGQNGEQQLHVTPYIKTILDQGPIGSCFPPGTLIRMADNSERRIEEIRVLDKVVSAEGRPQRVMQVMAREHDGDVVRLKVNGSHHVRCTPEHPILTENGYVNAVNLKLGDKVAFPRYAPETVTCIQTVDYVHNRRCVGARRAIKSKHQSVAYRTIPGKTVGTYKVHPLPDLIELTRGFGRIIGLFLAEGSTCYGKAVWSFAEHERDTLVAELVSLLKSECGQEAAVQLRGPRNSHCIKVNVHGVHWARLFEALCGKLAGGKRIHPDLCSGPRDFLEGVLTGWTDGDGIGKGRLGGRTVSHSMAMNMFDIATYLGHQPHIYVQQAKLSHGVKSRQPVWNVGWGDGAVLDHFTYDYRKHQTDTHLWRRVEGIELEPYNGVVFNLEVEEDHSYVAEGIGVHNCAAEGAAGCVMVLRALAGLPHVVLNPYFIYHTTSGGSDQGSYLSDTVAFLASQGCASEAVWPRSHGFRTAPSQNARQDALKYRQLKVVKVANWEEYGTMLLNAWPVYSAYPGHAWFGAQLIAPDRIRWCNSWGTDWGEGGFGTLAASSIQFKSGIYCFLAIEDGGEQW